MSAEPSELLISLCDDSLDSSKSNIGHFLAFECACLAVTLIVLCFNFFLLGGPLVSDSETTSLGELDKIDIPFFFLYHEDLRCFCFQISNSCSHSLFFLFNFTHFFC